MRLTGLLIFLCPFSTGLLIDEAGLEEKHKKKEQHWVGNFQKYSSLTDQEKAKLRDSSEGASYQANNVGNNSGNSKSPLRGSIGGGGLLGAPAGASRGQRPSTAPIGEKKRKNAENHNSQPEIRQRSKCSDPSIPMEDLIMMGLYRLDDEQEQIYRAFVDMVSCFDEYDKV
jgi:hypothetical protein